MKTMDKIEEVLTRGVEKIYPSKEALEKVLRSGKKIRLYQGFDPSMSNLHLGNMVGILKLAQFQKLGHQVIFLIGDFTGMIGDPTDKSATRHMLTRVQVTENAKTWKEQAGRFLNFGGKNPVKILRNSQWSDKVSFKGLIEITAHFTVQQMIERDFFQKRLKVGRPIHLHEFLYPVAQAYDSVAMDVDLEIGGSDQTFNMLCGRTLMAAMKGKEKFVLTTKLLVDSKGQKAGKTAGNALFLNAKPEEMFGGVMSFPDEVIPLALELLTEVPLKEVKKAEEALKDKAKNPMVLKKRLALEIAKLNFGPEAAKRGQRNFEKLFQKRQMENISIPIFRLAKPTTNIVDLLVACKLASSRSEAKRLVKQGAVDLDGIPINKYLTPILLKNGTIIRVGKHLFRKIKIIGKNN